MSIDKRLDGWAKKIQSLVSMDNLDTKVVRASLSWMIVDPDGLFKMIEKEGS